MNGRILKCNAFIFILIILVAIVGVAAINSNIYVYDSNISLTINELSEVKAQYPITCDVEQIGNDCKLTYKLCNCLPIKTINVQLQGKSVYLGGKPLGLAMRVGGLIINRKLDVVTDSGLVSPAKDLDIQSGDILLAINGKKVLTPEEVAKLIGASNGAVTITIKRGEQTINMNIAPVVDALSKTKKLGLWLREDIEGIGTLTYVDKSSGRYGALGHVIKDFESGVVYDRPNGDIYNADIYGVVKGERGKAGELSGGFNKVNASIGTLDTNCDFGVFGYYHGDTQEMQEIKLGSKYSVRPGKAHIYTTVDGNQPKKYEIEIIKNSHQTSAKTRGLLIRVTDKELLSKTGGIVQGMSGSPIIQNGRLIGAVTHVFIGDPTKGYGTYIDWMLPN